MGRRVDEKFVCVAYLGRETKCLVMRERVGRLGKRCVGREIWYEGCGELCRLLEMRRARY